MNTEIKTYDDWMEFTERTGRKSIYDYLRKGDVVDECLVQHFMNILPPRALSHRYLQTGEPFSHVYDIDRRLRPTFMTFAKCNGVWRFYGNCFSYETVDKTYC